MRSRTRACAARRTRGWFSPPQSSWDLARCGAPWFFFSPVAGCRPCLLSPLRVERGRGARGATGEARAARAACVKSLVVLAAAVEQGRSRGLLFFSCTPSWGAGDRARQRREHRRVGQGGNGRTCQGHVTVSAVCGGARQTHGRSRRPGWSCGLVVGLCQASRRRARGRVGGASRSTGT